ncbi:hypothetical protein ACHQM5_016402 [Ranunculus cassubicifolius]
MAGSKPATWSRWLSLGEYWFNTSFHSSLKMTPFQALYGYEPPHISLPAVPAVLTSSVTEFLLHRQALITVIKDSLIAAQSRMQFYANRKRKDREFVVGQSVYLRLQPYRQLSMGLRKNFKLAPKFFGPYPIIQRIGKVAYKLQLPETAKIHNVFHVSQLKLQLGQQQSVQSDLMHVPDLETATIQPVKVLNQRSIARGNRWVRQYLIQWSNATTQEATWETYNYLRAHFPTFVLEDKDSFKGEGLSGPLTKA